MKFFAALCFFSLIIFSCNNVSEKEYKDSKENLLERERSNPLDFLSVSHTDKRNLLGQTVVRGTIKSNATVCSYKNVRVKMLYHNSDGKLVTNHEEVIEKLILPNQEIKFKAKYFTPKGTDSVALSIMRAEVADEKKAENK